MDGDLGAAPASLQRLRLLTWWSTTGLVGVSGIAGVLWLLLAHPPTPVSGAVALGVAASTAAAAALFARALRQPAAAVPGAADEGARTLEGAPVWVAVVGVLGALAVGLGGPQLLDRPGWSLLPLAVIASALAVSAPRGRKVPVLAGGLLVAVAVAAAAGLLAPTVPGRQLVQTALVVVPLFGFTFLSQLWIWETTQRLDAARRLAAELAVADERLRFAAELHDIQGHHLQVIALKSELAARTAEGDPEAAAAHMIEVQRLARTALEDTREVVRGYRRVSLADELANAARVLAAAGIDCHPPAAVAVAEQLPEPTRHLLGLVVREATTNVLRHSQARSAAVSLAVEGATAVLEIRNDGSSGAADEAGTGLAALAERVAATGGTLEWVQDGEWFRLTARVPVPELVRA